MLLIITRRLAFYFMYDYNSCGWPRDQNGVGLDDPSDMVWVIVAHVEELDRFEIEPQSGLERFNVSVNEPNREQKVTTAAFADQNPAYSYVVDSEPDMTFKVADMDDADLNNFFSRPLKIATIEWSVPNFAYSRFNPWSLYFQNPRVINRVSNFKLMRAKLHVKVLINGNGFYYGRSIMSYLPLHKLDEFTVSRSFYNQDIVSSSQRPHIYLDPTTSQGGEMVLPFFWYKNALSVPDEEWDDMGELIIHSINALKHANAASEPVTISVFAWAEDVQLSIPTSVEPGGIAPQCGFEDLEPHAGDEPDNSGSGKGGGGNAPAPAATSSGNDEYGSGPISKPASVVAKIAGMLSNAPIIGPYARATQMAASTTASVASMFGYSRPPVIADIVPYKPTHVGNLANTNVPDSLQKLSLDVKQEVTVDPRTVGLCANDEMDLKTIAMRESYVTQFTWDQTAVTETLLWNTEVTPVMWAENDISSPSEIHMTPSCLAVMPFGYWRGSMKFRFQIVSSHYHKGRIRISYDPHIQTGAEYNTNYQYIIDIAENKDFTVTIGWGQERAYCTHDTPGDSAVPYGTLPIGTIPGASANGVLSVYVVNTLTSPNSQLVDDIEINVFTSMCDDFEVGGPTSSHIENFGFTPYPTAARSATADDVWPLGLADLQRRLNEDAVAAASRVNLLDADAYVDKNKLDWTDYSHQFYDWAEGRRDMEIEPHSGVETTAQADSDNTQEQSTPIATQEDARMASNVGDDMTLGVFLGEAVTSVRQILKRYNYHTTFGATQSGVNTLVRVANNLPYYRGFESSGIHTANSPAGGGPRPYNRCKCTTMNWFLPSFTGWRGATRWKYQTVADIKAAVPYVDETFMEVSRFPSKRTAYSEGFAPFVSSGTANAIAEGNVDVREHSFVGVTRVCKSLIPVIEVELPWYSNLRFFPAKKKSLTASTAFTEYHQFQTVTDLEATGDTGTVFDTFCSVGEDFSSFFFTGAPIVYNYGRLDISSV